MAFWTLITVVSPAEFAWDCQIKLQRYSTIGNNLDKSPENIMSVVMLLEPRNRQKENRLGAS